MLGLLTVVLLAWGIIAFWGTPWSICGLVLLAIDALVAAYKTGLEHNDEEEE